MSGHVRRNRDRWDADAARWVAPGERAWADAPSWGLWGVPEAEVGVFGPGVHGLDVVELGCGTGYVSSWVARAGGRPVAIDNSSRQLATARRLQEEHDVRFPLVWADAERTPLADGCADLVVSEYGACLWCDPEAWVPEAARLLRPGGRLAFLTTAPLLVCCEHDDGSIAADELLRRSYFELGRMDWPDDDGIEFHLTHGRWIELLGRHGLVVDALHELQAAEDASAALEMPHVDAAWARRWPTEDVWLAHLR